MKLARILVLGFGLFYIGFGLCFAVLPVRFFAMSTDEILRSPAGISEIRAVYGGLGIGVGIWMLFCLRENLRLGLVGLVATSGSIALFRAVGLIFDGAPEPAGTLFLFSEAAIVLVAAIGLRSLRRDSSTSRSEPRLNSEPRTLNAPIRKAFRIGTS